MNFNRSSYRTKKVGNLTIHYYSISYDGTVLLFIIDGIAIQGDAGAKIHMLKKKIILITHTDRDHVDTILNSIGSDNKRKKTNAQEHEEEGGGEEEEIKKKIVFIPKGKKKLLIQLMKAYHRFTFPMYLPDEVNDKEHEGELDLNSPSIALEIKEVEHGDLIEHVVQKKRSTVTLLFSVYKAFHGTDKNCVSYGVSKIVMTKKKEFRRRIGKEEMKELQAKGIVIEERIEKPLFLFCGDTSIRFIDEYPELLRFDKWVIECTRIPDLGKRKALSEEELQNFYHITWEQLKPYVLKYKHITWILHHMSTEYFVTWDKSEQKKREKEERIIEYFKEYPNVVLLL